MVRVTDDKEVKEAVLAGLQRNKEKYGKRYCPCSLVRNDDTVCMCKEFREMEEGIDRKSTRLNSSHSAKSRMPSSA